MRIKNQYNKTIAACFTGYIVQAVVNNFAPLLFLLFQETYHIPLSQITLLVTFNFGIQLLVDLLSVRFADRIGYRASMVAAHIFSAAGLILLTVLPDLLPVPFAGILISVMFYCWGYAGVVLVSTLFFHLAGMENWKFLALAWAFLPICNAFAFTRVPMAPLLEDGESEMTPGSLFKNKLFWVLLVMMVCAGASEQAVSQWASVFAEKGLGISKSAGDLAGPMAFALLMGLSRLFYGKYGHRINLERFMAASGLLCIVSYLGISLLPVPQLSLAACAVCGLSVGIMWPGTFSKAAASLPKGGTAMFALLALGGDIGCSGGPTLVGLVSDAMDNDLKIGILAGVLFPLLLSAGIVLAKRPEVKCSNERDAVLGKA